MNMTEDQLRESIRDLIQKGWDKIAGKDTLIPECLRLYWDIHILEKGESSKVDFLKLKKYINSCLDKEIVNDEEIIESIEFDESNSWIEYDNASNVVIFGDPISFKKRQMSRSGEKQELIDRCEEYVGRIRRKMYSEHKKGAFLNPRRCNDATVFQTLDGRTYVALDNGKIFLMRKTKLITRYR